jgi:hypothetical protein
MWLMEGNFSRNARVTYRFTGTKIIEDSVITDPIPQEFLERVKQPGMIHLGSPAIGSRNTRMVESADGNPGRTVRQQDQLSMVPRIAWLAFCSGPCLRREGRTIFPPSSLWKELVSASSFKDRTVVFDDPLGLPKVMELFTTDRQPVMQYRVVNSTNILGWDLPLEFYLVQYRPAPVPELKWVPAGTNGWELEFMARGTVKTVAATSEIRSSSGTSDKSARVSK